MFSADMVSDARQRIAAVVLDYVGPAPDAGDVVFSTSGSQILAPWQKSWVQVPAPPKASGLIENLDSDEPDQLLLSAPPSDTRAGRPSGSGLEGLEASSLQPVATGGVLMHVAFP